ncbi:hypothetical protein D3C81_375460 [compost metagenome]
MGQETATNSPKSVDQIIADAKARNAKGQQGRKRTKGNSTTDNPTEGEQRKPKPTDGITILEQGKEKVVLGLAAVDGENGEPKKKKREPRKATKKQSVQEGAQSLTVLLKTVSDISSIRLGQLWQLSEAECKAIADPLASIMDRYHLLDKMGEYGEFMALGLALSAAFVPRVFISLQIKKERRVKHAGTSIPPNLQKQPARTGTGTGEKPVAEANTGDNRQSDSASRPSTHGDNAVKQLLPGLMQ